MPYKALGQCPVCQEDFTISKLTCSNCHSSLEGEFSPCKFCRLPPEQLEFIEVFIKCRGSIKDVEKALKISYPTVRSRLDSVIQSLGYEVNHNYGLKQEEKRQEILEAVEQGELTSAEAAKLLRRQN